MSPLEYCKKQFKIKTNPHLDEDNKNQLILIMVAEDLDKVFKPKRSDKK